MRRGRVRASFPGCEDRRLLTRCRKGLWIADGCRPDAATQPGQHRPVEDRVDELEPMDHGAHPQTPTLAVPHPNEEPGASRSGVDQDEGPRQVEVRVRIAGCSPGTMRSADRSPPLSHRSRLYQPARPKPICTSQGHTPPPARAASSPAWPAVERQRGRRRRAAGPPPRCATRRSAATAWPRADAPRVGIPSGTSHSSWTDRPRRESFDRDPPGPPARPGAGVGPRSTGG